MSKRARGITLLFLSMIASLVATAQTVEYLHILSTGQSLAAGGFSTPVLSTTQPYNNMSLTYYPGGFVAPLIPLHEVDQEGPSCGMANTFHALDPAERAVIVGLHAQNNKLYTELKKGTTIWDVAMDQVTISKAEVENISGNAVYVPMAVTVVHGETDHFNGNAPLYQGYLEEWQSDYETDISAIVGSQQDIPMFVSQMNTGWTGELAVAQYQTHKDNPGKIFLVGPKYQYGYHTDHLHLRNVDSKHMGEMFGKVIGKVVLQGNAWSPLMPTGVHRNANVITIVYHIPVGTLALDTTTLAKRPNFGFEFVQTGGNTVTITHVALVNGNTHVQITLDSIPTGTDQKVRYAYTCYRGGAGFGRCGNGADSASVGGNLRDTDASVSPAIGSTGLPLYDWGVTFEEPVLGPLTTASATPSMQLDIFPNPAHGELNIALHESQKPIESIALTDLSGKEIRRWDNLGSGSEISVSVQDLPAGIYLLAIKIGDAAEVFRKVVLN